MSDRWIGQYLGFSCDFREILILAEDHGDIELLASSHANDVEAQAQVYALFPRNVEIFRAAIWMSNRFAAVPESARGDVHSGTTHGGQSASPVAVPPWVSFRRRHPGVEARGLTLPAVLAADGITELDGIEVRVVMPEGRLGVMEEVLSIDETDGVLGRRLLRHRRYGERK